jgi:hypothetical protein
MAQIVKARLTTWTTFGAQPRMVPDLNEGPLEHVDRDLFRVSSSKEESTRSPAQQIAMIYIDDLYQGEGSNSLRSEGDKTTLEEFRVSDRQNGSGEIHVAYL